MICAEDQFRAILREEAADITPGSVPPLRLPDRQLADPGRGRGRGSGTRWRRVIVPLGAAAAVTGIAVAATVMGGSEPAVSRPPAAPTTPGLWHGVPEYDFGVTGIVGRARPELVAGDTRSGRILATAHSPSTCMFNPNPAAAGDDRTLALTCTGRSFGQKALVYLARFNPVTRTLSVTTSRLPEIPDVVALAISADGSQIATASVADFGGRRARTMLTVYSVADGRAERTWSAAGTAQGLSWGAGSLLAFGYSGVTHPGQTQGIRLLDTGAASGNLLHASRLALPWTLPGGYELFGPGPVLSGNSATIATGLSVLRPKSVTGEFAEFSTATGRMLRHWAPTFYPGEEVIWSDRTGKTLVVLFPAHRDSANVVLGIMTGERFTPLRQPGRWATNVVF
jgi:hypothetical protein